MNPVNCSNARPDPKECQLFQCAAWYQRDPRPQRDPKERPGPKEMNPVKDDPKDGLTPRNEKRFIT